MNFYNEHDPKAAAWLRELIRAGAIPPGDVDERSIVDLQPADLTGYTQCHFFAGIAGWSLALDLAGWPADRPCGTGSCPCQPFSPAGKGLGKKDERHLWPAFFALIVGCRAAGQPWTDVIFGEQVERAIKHEWLDGVCDDLEGEGYAVGAHVLASGGTGAQGHPWLTQSADFWRLVAERAPVDPATAERLRAAAQWLGELRCGPPHIRARLFWVAYAAGERERPRDTGGNRGRGLVMARPEQRRDAGHAGTTGRLAQPEHAERRPLDGRDENGHHRPDGGREETHGELGTRGEIHPRRLADDHEVRRGSWGDFDVLPCLDGKARRVASGTFPLAHGVPGRVGLLRGYGNAIVPQVAAEFIAAFLEVETADLRPLTSAL